MPAASAGLYRGEGAFPYTWEPVLENVAVEWMAIGPGNRLYVAAGTEEGHQVGCYTGTGQTLGRPQAVPVANHLLHWSGIFRHLITSIVPDPRDPERFYLATADGGVYSATCGGDSRHLGQRPFLATPSSLVVTQSDGQQRLLWANRWDFSAITLE